MNESNLTDYKYPLENLNDYFKMFMDYFPGTVVLTDGNGKILFINDFCLKIWRDDPNELIGKHVSAFRINGWAPETGTEYVLKNNTRSIKFFKTKYGDGLLTVSIPVFGKNGLIDGVVTFGLVEEVIYDYIKKIEFEKNDLKQLINFLNRNEDSIVVESQEMRKIFIFLDQIKAADSAIMLYGESGSGKEVIAKYIHQTSVRSMQPFVPVNCAAIPEALMEAEFFGYEKGAFTGASKEGKLGFFQLANKGTLFLDEIGELPFALQAKLLRVIETGEIRRIGSEKLTFADVRIIAATNRDLHKMAQEGTFRSDLYYRLNILPITIPPLRERQGDIQALIKVFLERYDRKYGRNHTLSSHSMEILMGYDWPGNVRELKNIIERLVITNPSNIIEVDEAYFPKRPKHQDNKPILEPDKKTKEHEEENFAPLKEAVANFEKQYIASALEICDRDVFETARYLKVSLSGLYKKINLYGLNQPFLK